MKEATYTDYKLIQMMPATGFEAVFRDDSGKEWAQPVVAWGHVEAQEIICNSRGKPTGDPERYVVALLVDPDGSGEFGLFYICNGISNFVRVQPVVDPVPFRPEAPR